MTGRWSEQLRVDPVPGLLARQDVALTCFVRRDLLDDSTAPVETLPELPEARSLTAKQLPDGSWRYPGKSYDPLSNTNYNLLETYRNLRLLVEMYAFRRAHPVLAKAAEYVFSCQADEGDIRGILGNQHMPYYHAALLGLLIKSGYADDPRLEKGLTWLLSVRQQDGGWVIPAQLIPPKHKTSELWHARPLPTDPSRPSSHIATDMVLRAFIAHPGYCSHPAVLAAAHWLKGRMFLADTYNDRKGPDYWLKFQFPFWFHSIVSTLDSLSCLGFRCTDEAVASGLAWFMHNQAGDGLWETGYGSGKQAAHNRAWVGLAVCRVLKRFFGEE